MRQTALISFVLAAAVLSGCDLFGESTEALAAAKEAEGKAIGGACRHAGRAIEDCYARNRKADKASVFAGWRDMNDYMRENKIEAVPPQAAAAVPEPRSAEAKPEPKSDAEPAAETTEKRPARSSTGKTREPRSQDS